VVGVLAQLATVQDRDLSALLAATLGTRLQVRRPTEPQPSHAAFGTALWTSTHSCHRHGVCCRVVRVRCMMALLKWLMHRWLAPDFTYQLQAPTCSSTCGMPL
jgi:hypothetical protein